MLSPRSASATKVSRMRSTISAALLAASLANAPAGAVAAAGATTTAADEAAAPPMMRRAPRPWRTRRGPRVQRRGPSRASPRRLSRGRTGGGGAS
uniref:Uncharacterized protein n=1 Tax=Setaria viridis TaxID=4556 RepID=A0A4U6T670_SETVI|nr:hypothetical protein SEVIR_9G372066v2 [Setaria viridis]